MMAYSVAFIGFGEAAQAFAGDRRWTAKAVAFDILTDHDATRAAQLGIYAAAGVTGCDRADAAVAPILFSLVTADRAAGVAADTARFIAPGTLFLDLNSVAPQTKSGAAEMIEAAGGRYVDVAVMAPVQPARMSVPLLVSGPHAEVACTALLALGFTNLRQVAGAVGRASSIKMIRSVIVKGIEALTAEAMIAADGAGVVDEVLASLGGDWAAKADYNLERMIVHGWRRAAEMEEVVKTLVQLGVPPLMTRGTVIRQREIGTRKLAPPPGLAAKLDVLATRINGA